MSEKFTFDLVQHIGTIAKKGDRTLELNIVAWNGRPPKFDIREWNEDHTTMTRGITLTEEDAASLAKILQEHFNKK